MQVMEQLGHGHERHPLEDAVMLLNEDQAIQFVEGGGVRVISYLEKPYRNPFLDGEYESLQELVAHIKDTAGLTDTDGDYPNMRHIIKSPDFLEWKSALPPTEVFKAVAEDMLQKRDADFMSHTVQGKRSTFWSDTDSSRSFVLPKYPRVVLLNEADGTQEEFIFDVVALLAAGEITCELDGHEVTDGESEHASYAHILRLQPYMHAKIRALGIDPYNAMHFETIDDNVVLTDLRTISDDEQLSWNTWSLTPDVLGPVVRQDSPMNVETFLEDAQADIAHLHAASLPEEDEEDFAEGLDRTYILRTVRPLAETIHDLQTVLQTLGDYTLGFISNSGNYACVLNNNGDVVARLSGNTSVREAAENAWLTLQSLQKHADY